MAGKYGSASVFFLVDGYNLITTKLKGLSYKITALHEETTGLGDAVKNSEPTGLTEVELKQDQGFFDTTTNGGHAALKAPVSDPQAAQRVICAGFAGHTSGEQFVGFQGSYQQEYEVLGEVGNLTKANAAYQVSGTAEHGEIVQPLATKTADWNTKTLSTQVDSLASSANGAAGYQQVTALSGFSGFIGKIRDSSDDITYADLITFADVTAAPNAQRVTAAGTVDRYLSYDGDVTGSGSITVFSGLSRL